MDTQTRNYQLDSELTLCTPSLSPLNLRAIALSLTKQDDQLIECRLTLIVNQELYKRIDTDALFNLKPEVRGSFSAGKFQPELDIKIEISLKPDSLPHLVEHAASLPHLVEHAADVNEAANYILNLSQEQPGHPLLYTENWLGLSVKQQQESGETGYSTFWAYINPSALANGETSSEEIGNAIANFFKEWTEANLSEMTQNATSDILEGIVDFFQEMADVTIDAIAGVATSSGQIFEEMVNFFKEDEWPFYQIKGEPVLQMAFQGENGKWTCYAKVREKQEQFVFYSVCPVNAPENKRMAIAEFITRANSGTIVGNFELDFADGEIRYKTSIDVEGDRLSPALIKQLVYANVTMMDEYLPGIMSVIYSDVSPADAIAQIEE
ncbi:YbjN domain-containing protein [Cyanobacteria bacterium FACHB-472]|nr:YbjN domain-containing protein [Cyanobacteria bacterium FACHB-472]